MIISEQIQNNSKPNKDLPLTMNIYTITINMYILHFLKYYNSKKALVLAVC